MQKFAENKGLWRLGVRLAIEASNKGEAVAILGQALANLNRGMPVLGEPVLRPRQFRLPDSIWVPELEPDMSVFYPIENDSARTRCALVQTYFPSNKNSWMVRVNTDRQHRVEWPPDIWAQTARAG